jgi:hypothetical protein
MQGAKLTTTRILLDGPAFLNSDCSVFAIGLQKHCRLRAMPRIAYRNIAAKSKSAMLE